MKKLLFIALILLGLAANAQPKNLMIAAVNRMLDVYHGIINDKMLGFDP